ncbi:hypothetical protein BSNK01_19670 [Bacillaceae bacterium]
MFFDSADPGDLNGCMTKTVRRVRVAIARAQSKYLGTNVVLRSYKQTRGANNSTPEKIKAFMLHTYRYHNANKGASQKGLNVLGMEDFFC